MFSFRSKGTMDTLQRVKTRGEMIIVESPLSGINTVLVFPFTLPTFTRRVMSDITVIVVSEIGCLDGLYGGVGPGCSWS